MPPPPEMEMVEEQEQEQYVKVAWRFYRVKLKLKPREQGGGGMAHHRRRLHYLDSCFLCKKSIACNQDIFMYRGDAAFCSDDCRQEQMDMDEALDAVARRHRLLLLRTATAPSSPSPAAEVSRPPPMMRRRPTIANLAARNPAVTAS